MDLFLLFQYLDTLLLPCRGLSKSTQTLTTLPEYFLLPLFLLTVVVQVDTLPWVLQLGLRFSSKQFQSVVGCFYALSSFSPYLQVLGNPFFQVSLWLSCFTATPLRFSIKSEWHTSSYHSASVTRWLHSPTSKRAVWLRRGDVAATLPFTLQ